jgi:hypothetical protein
MLQSDSVKFEALWCDTVDWMPAEERVADAEGQQGTRIRKQDGWLEVMPDKNWNFWFSIWAMGRAQSFWRNQIYLSDSFVPASQVWLGGILCGIVGIYLKLLLCKQWVR